MSSQLTGSHRYNLHRAFRVWIYNLHCPSNTYDICAQDVNLVPTLGALFVLGALVGPPLDSLHSGIGLLIYDKFPITIGALCGPSQYIGWHLMLHGNDDSRTGSVLIGRCHHVTCV